jgi:hypothetical protein
MDSFKYPAHQCASQASFALSQYLLHCVRPRRNNSTGAYIVEVRFVLANDARRRYVSVYRSRTKSILLAFGKGLFYKLAFRVTHLDVREGSFECACGENRCAFELISFWNPRLVRLALAKDSRIHFLVPRALM